jgi:hypothetical protein
MNSGILICIINFLCSINEKGSGTQDVTLRLINWARDGWKWKN